jgi:hypothetical protein
MNRKFQNDFINFFFSIRIKANELDDENNLKAIDRRKRNNQKNSVLKQLKLKNSNKKER